MAQTFLQQYKESKKQSLIQPVKQEFKQSPSKRKDLDWWNPLSWVSTIGDVAGDVLTGAGKTIEGIADLGIGAVGSIAGLFGSDSLENALAEAVKYDVAGNTLGKLDESLGSKSLLGDNSIIHDVAGGVGGMLPAVAVGIATGGAGFASMGTFMAGAGGQSTEQALNDGASLRKATLYGAGSGVVEGGIEYLSGKLGGTNILGKGAMGKVFSGGLGKVAKTFAEEGLEEVASDVIDPFLKRATYKDTLEMPTIGELAKTFGVGGLTAMAMGGSAKAINLSKYGVKGEKAVSLYNEAQQLNAEAYELEKKGKLTPELRQDYLNKRNDLLAQVGNTMSEISNENKKSRVGNAITPTMEQTANFDARKQAVYEANELSNKKNGTNFKVEFVNKKEMNKRIKENNAKLNKNVEELTSDTDGFLDRDTNTIVINEESKNPFSLIYGHEVVHYLQNKQMYSEMASDVLSTMSAQELDNEYEVLRKNYGKNIKKEQMDKEIVANQIAKIVSGDSKSLFDTFAKKPNIVKRLLNWVETRISEPNSNSYEVNNLMSLKRMFQNVLTSETNVAKDSNYAVEYMRGANNVNINTDGISKKMSKQKYSSVVAQIQDKLYELHKTDSYLENILITFSDTNDLAFVKSSSLDAETNVISNSKIEYIEIDDYCSSVGLNSVNAENIMLRVKEMIEDVYKQGNDCKPKDFRKYRQLARREELQHLGSESSSNASEQQRIVESNSSKSSNDRKRISKDSGKDETIEYMKSSNDDIATQEDIEKLKHDEINEKLKNQVKTQLIEEDMSWIDNIKVLTERGKQAIIDAFNNRDALKSKMQILLTNSFAGVENELKSKIEQEGIENGWSKTQIKEEIAKQTLEVKIAYNRAYRSVSGAEYKIGRDLKKLWSKINKKGFNYTNDFELFLLHRLNTKRMSLAEKYKALDAMYKAGKINKDTYDKIDEELSHIKEKPVFGEDITSEFSREEVARLQKEHPEFIDLANEVYDYLASLMEIRKTAGIVNQKQIDFMLDAYGDAESGKSWYVPTYRDLKHGANTSALSGNIGVTKGIHKAKGSDLDIQSIMLSMSEQTIGVHKQSAINQLFKVVHDKLPEHFEKQGVKKQSREDMNGEIEILNDKEKNTTVYFYENGERVEYKCSSFIGVAFESIRNQKSDFEKILDNTTGKMVSLMKKLTTEWNPFFAVRNFFRDASDAFIYTKYNPNLIKRYAETYQEIRKGDKSGYYELYMINGGQNFSFFDKEKGIKDKKKLFLIEKISQLNEAIELLPRLSEFMESLKAQGYDNVTLDNINNIPQEVIDKAMFEASEITVNFARGGTFAKKMNKYLMPYLNASIQGWCKTWNTFVHPTSMHAWCMSMSKVVLMALPTLLFNEIFYDDDEEYQQLADDVKGSYFLIKTGNNKFIRIPRGRVEAVVGDALQRLYRTSKGEENAFDGYASNTLKNVSPVDNLTRSILSPFTDVSTNTTWYGGNIENASMQKLPVNERYDNNTSEIAKILNKVVPSISPKKWHYLLDQYSGVLGDVILPLTSKNKDLSGLSGLTVNSLENNKYTNKFYDTQTKLEQDKNSENGTAVDKAKMRYFNKMNTKVSELYKESKTTTDEETRLATQKLIVQLQKQTLENLDKFSVTLEKYSYGLSIEELYEDYYREATRECFGAETALMDYDKRVYEKAINFNKAGIDWNTFYNVYFDAQDITSDYDANGDVVSGSRKQKVTQYMKSLRLTATQKYMLMGLLGYKNANGESQVRSQLIRSGFRGEELEVMLELCGY